MISSVLSLHADAENLRPGEALRCLEDQEGRVVLPTEAGACPRADPNHRVMVSLLHAGILDLVVTYVRTRPGADVLITSAVPGDGSPLEFYRRYGFRDTGELFEGEHVLQLPLAGDVTTR